ncbi:3-isopropylmalate dehydrogenase [Haliscomenobacter hydrossis]|uniref:3-isopropylmalate dehydrogenase n=1 Tax=Haliscomenobacter hydrossis (strain ATCC 27775 / DSM 1100 / LMG 10767 / O) TaxID=760192 RepID=F4L0A1_HALH1|nr:3-isopropylmalate dehydrogenase [Haliscomenobacter hydrossis]AEE53774.1 3-isopropylmalate dehydrogenase [Haliscomenobacter hydrossis DSM 1100]
MDKKIAVLPGDGVGPEVVEQGVKVLEAIADRFQHKFTLHYLDVGAAAIEKFGTPLPSNTLEVCQRCDAILFGAVGDPKYTHLTPGQDRPEQGILQLRKKLGLFANIRPVRTIPSLLHLSPLKKEKIKNVDFVIYRELTGGVYFGTRGRNEDGSAYDVTTYHAREIERIARMAFKQALKRKGKVTLVDKANVMETSRLWRETVCKIGQQYPSIQLDFLYADNAAMQMILNPRDFDVILADNLFGDILSDEAGAITGSIGLLPSASVGDGTPLFEPIHGSFPRAAGEDIANPMATILSVAMMMDHFKLYEEASVIRHKVRHALEKGIGTAELHLDTVYSCSQMGDMIAHLITDHYELPHSNSVMGERVATII